MTKRLVEKRPSPASMSGLTLIVSFFLFHHHPLHAIYEPHINFSGFFSHSFNGETINKPKMKKTMTTSPMAGSKLMTINQFIQDEISIGECSYEEMVKQICCHARDEIPSEVVQQPPTKKRKLSKKVRIAEENNELFYRPYGREEWKSTWMSDADFKAIKEGNRETLITILKACGEMEKVNAHKFCLRGLESHIEMFYTKSKRVAHKMAINRVLEDQCAQRFYGIEDPDSLSQVYSELSQQSTLRAIELAFVDSLR